MTGVHCYLIWRATPAPPALGPRAGKHVCTRPTSLATLPDDREAAPCVEPVMVRPACQISVNLFIGDKICGALADDRASGDQYFVRWVLLGYPLVEETTKKSGKMVSSVTHEGSLVSELMTESLVETVFAAAIAQWIACWEDRGTSSDATI